MDLPPDYYLYNFRSLLQAVKAHSSDLLHEGEQRFLQQLSELPEASELLLVRLLTRKGDLFRQDRLDYPEIGAIDLAVAPLMDAGFVESARGMPPDTLLPLFTKGECLNALDRYAPAWRDSGLKPSSRRDLIVEQVLVRLDAEHFADWFPCPVYHLQVGETFELLKLLFFGNAGQDLTEFVLRDLGLQRFMPYRLDAETRLFQHREQLEAHRRFHALRDLVQGGLPSDAASLRELYEQVPTGSDRVLHRRSLRFRFQLARQLERIGALEEALPLYQDLALPQAREREARILAKTGQANAALVRCSRMLEDPATEAEHRFAQGFGARLAKKIGQPWPSVLVQDPPEERLRLPPHPEGVERAVAQALSDAATCAFVENHLVLTVFGLLYWEVIFSPVRGAFTHPFQYRPHDLYEPDFLVRREECKAVADDLLEDSEQFQQVVLERWQVFEGIANPFVFWGVKTDILQLGLERIPPEDWRAFFDRIWKDLRENRSGLPDLVRFPDAGGYELIEVKGPGDRLQDNQKRWMDCFAVHNIPHRVVHVTWEGSADS